MKSIILLLCLGLLACSPTGAAKHAAAAATPGGAANPLIGAWNLTEGDPSSCGTTLIYTADSEASTFPDATMNSNENVTFRAVAGKVFVTGEDGVEQFDIDGPTVMHAHATPICRYQRAG